MKRFPAELEDLLSPRGRRVLAGKDRISGVLAAGLQFVSAPDLLSPKLAREALVLLEETMRDVLTPLDTPIPRDSIAGMKKNYAELLPKTVRVSTALMASGRSKGSQRAAEIGLTGLLR